MPGSDDRLIQVALPNRLLLLARLCIGLVLAWNIQCALAFLIAPAPYAVAFELTGPPGEAAIRGVGLLFLMWNVPYAVALWHPARHRTSMYEALAMQAIGLLGESLLLLSLLPVHATARTTLIRFIAFDGAGLLLLVLATLSVRGYTRHHAYV